MSSFIGTLEPVDYLDLRFSEAIALATFDSADLTLTRNGSCEGVLQPHEWQALYATIHGEIYPHLSPPTLAEVVRWIAQLGGFLGRKGDGEPGVKVLWRGLTRLDDIAQTWLLANSLG